MQSHSSHPGGFHVAVITDGNGRWALQRGLPRSAGHREGVEAVRRIVDASPALGITTLTFFAFSADNWRRPAAEIADIMALLCSYLEVDTDELVRRAIRFGVIGRRDRLPAALTQRIAAAEHATLGCRGLHLRVALDYSARHAIVEATAALARQAAPDFDDLPRLISQAASGDAEAASVDLLIRPGGEKRLSDFLLWEAAYAELWFSDRMWPDFGVDDLRAAIADFGRRDRRFGNVSRPLAASA